VARSGSAIVGGGLVIAGAAIAFGGMTGRLAAMLAAIFDPSQLVAAPAGGTGLFPVIPGEDSGAEGPDVAEPGTTVTSSGVSGTGALEELSGGVDYLEPTQPAIGSGGGTPALGPGEGGGEIVPVDAV
jgi:hypothetical protein